MGETRHVHRPSCASLLAWDIPNACDCDRPAAVDAAELLAEVERTRPLAFLGAALLTAVKEAQTAGGYWLDITAGDAYLRVWGAQKDTDATRALAAALRASLSRQPQEGREP